MLLRTNSPKDDLNKANLGTENFISADIQLNVFLIEN